MFHNSDGPASWPLGFILCDASTAETLRRQCKCISRQHGGPSSSRRGAAYATGRDDR